MDREAARIGERVLIKPCSEANSCSCLRYFCSECDGGFAEYAVVASRHAYKVNTTLKSFRFHISTAENMLTRANVVATDRVLITGHPKARPPYSSQKHAARRYGHHQFVQGKFSVSGRTRLSPEMKTFWNRHHLCGDRPVAGARSLSFGYYETRWAIRGRIGGPMVELGPCI